MSMMDWEDKLSSGNIKCRLCIKHQHHELMKCCVFAMTKLRRKRSCVFKTVACHMVPHVMDSNQIRCQTQLLPKEIVF